MLFSWQQLQDITHGQWSGAPLPVHPKGVKAITDDSRMVTPGDLFIAVPGGRTDGHQFIDHAVRAGAIAVCVNKRRKEAKRTDLPLLCVDRTLNAFHELARGHRRRFPQLKVVGITGSSGKTSVRCMISAILDQVWPNQVLSTAGNTNNHFGVPRNLLRLTHQHRVAVLEIGSNQPGEIAQLTRLIRPHIGIITNIGAAHLQFLGDTLGVVMEKGCLLTGLQGESVAVIPDQTEHVEILRQIIGRRSRLTFGTTESSDIQVAYHGCTDKGCKLTLKWRQDNIVRPLTWHLGGLHQALNAAAAAAAATALGVSPDDIITGLRHTVLPEMRMAIIRTQKINWVNDAYNANPDSMHAGIEWFLELTAGIAPDKRWLILGDMLELGEQELQEHIKLLSWCQERINPDYIIPTGPLMQKAAAESGLNGCPDVQTAAGTLQQKVKTGSWVLLKGSRNLALEKIITQIQD